MTVCLLMSPTRLQLSLLLIIQSPKGQGLIGLCWAQERWEQMQKLLPALLSYLQFRQLEGRSPLLNLFACGSTSVLARNLRRCPLPVEREARLPRARFKSEMTFCSISCQRLQSKLHVLAHTKEGVLPYLSFSAGSVLVLIS